MSCNCVVNVNRQLRATGTHLAILIPRGEDGRAAGKPRVQVRVLHDLPTRRGIPIAVATHCPFCGTKYKD